MSANIHDQQPTLEALSAPEKSPIAGEQPTAGAYEPPRLTPAGNLLELLGKSGPTLDYRNRRFHQRKP